MLTRGRLTGGFVAVGAIQVLGVLWGVRLVPYSGTVLMLLLVAMALLEQRRAVAGGLAALTGLSVVLDVAAGGDGWSTPPPWRDDVAITVYAVLIAAATVLISLAVFGRDRPSRLVAGLAVLAGVVVTGLGYAGSPSDIARPNPVALAGALVIPAAALIVLFAAIGVALARRRFLLAIGLLPLALGGMGAVFAVSGLSVLRPAPDGCSAATTCVRFTTITMRAEVVAVNRMPVPPLPWTPPPSTAVPPDPVELPSSADFWSGPVDWARLGQAVAHALLLFCLGVLTASLVPGDDRLTGPGRWIPGR
jgi:hypothetical protein